MHLYAQGHMRDHLRHTIRIGPLSNARDQPSMRSVSPRPERPHLGTEGAGAACVGSVSALGRLG